MGDVGRREYTMNEPALTIELARSEFGTVIKPIGSVTIAQSPKLREKLQTAISEGPPSLVLDLSGVGFMDSSGVATLVEALQTCRNEHIPFSLCALQIRVQSIFEIARLNTIFTIYPTLEAATGIADGE